MSEDYTARGHPILRAFGNGRVKAARALREKKHRKAQGRFLAEGLRILTEARDAGALPEQIFYGIDAPLHPLAEDLIHAVERAGGDVFATTTDILSKLSGKENPQTVIGVYAERPTALDALDRSAADIWIVVQAMRDPGNLGTILRTGDAVGAGGVILIDDCVDPFSVEVVRASMGALFTQAIATARWDAFLQWLRAGPGQLVATSLTDAVPYRSATFSAPTFILIGNEAQGLPADYAAAADVRVRIPMLGRADSLNAAVACAVMAYEVRAQLSP